MSSDYGVGITFHAPGDHIGLFTDYPDIRAGMLEHFSKIIDVAQVLKSHHITFHPLSPPSFRKAATRENAFEKRYFEYFKTVLIDNLRALNAAANGPLICVENHELGTIAVPALSELLLETNQIGLTLDIPKSMETPDHPNSNQQDFFRTHKDRIYELHLHDMDDEISHLAPGDGGIDFTRFEVFLNADDPWTTIEVRPSHMAARSKEWLLNLRNETNVKQERKKDELDTF